MVGSTLNSQAVDPPYELRATVRRSDLLLAAFLLTPRCQQSPAIIRTCAAAVRCRHGKAQSRKGPVMNFVSMRLITDDIKRLVGFYQEVIGLTPTWYTEDFAELATPSCTLAIGSKRTMELFGAGAARPADNHSAIIEFRVEDVDKEYEKLAKVIGDFVQRPTTQPWGNRSLMFRDPDGNLINFFTPVSAEAIRRYEAGAHGGLAKV
jgi:predicted enzyme related to lactoylglutathione lyase